MIWHVVRFTLGSLDEETRRDVEGQLAALADLDVVEFLRVGRDVQQPEVTGLIVGVADEAALEAYRVHPDHLPVVRRIGELDIPRVAFDIASDDDPAVLA